MKKIYNNSIKTFKILKQILKKIHNEKEPITSAVFKKV